MPQDRGFPEFMHAIMHTTMHDEKEQKTPYADEVPVDTGTVECRDDLQVGLQRKLKPRHIQMIALGGVIGTGLFLGTASDLENGGPAGLLIAYCLMASLLYAVMVALGEMVSQFPIPGGQFALAGRFVSPELGFAMGVLYVYNYIIVLPAEISAAAVLITYWTPAGQTDSTCTTGICNNALWVGLMLLVVWLINVGGTKVFGEMEFWFCSIKVLTILGLIITGIIISAGGGPNHEAIGFKFWNETGGFVQYAGIAGAKGRFLGFFAVLIDAAFAFIGTEITAIAAAETASPAKNVPRAIKSVWIRLVLFYICSAFLIGILVSPSDPSLNLSSTAAKSPFVIAIKNAGIDVLPSIINAALLTSAWSAGCADLFVSSRALYGLAARGHAPRVFLKTRKDGLPWVCVLFCGSFSLLSFMAASQGKAGTVFGYFSNMTAICGMISWAGILWTSIRWHKSLKVHGIDRNTLPFRAPLQPYLSYYGICICVMVIIFGGFTAFIDTFDVSSFITTYFPILLFVVLFVGYKIRFKSGIIPLAELDFATGCSAVVEEGDDLVQDQEKSTWKKISERI
ncbi:putative arginine permease [Aspergillus sclerotiicarbonarius CBS 121057]|uniref:Putative arginine permease n=1 Tax=Aspergillus sclerotiicarbonarius (strain CBS 121057 / IBT 28362) TaxID=1448318 RepID=A0A319EA63_ASPSB|nr:putative arginine permease [Aspergillus sclerotiicarbonarius CBS 121057]